MPQTDTLNTEAGSVQANSMVFKSEEERMEAFDALPQDPGNVSPEARVTWQAEMEKKIDDIQNAPVDPDFTSQPETDDPTGQPSSNFDHKKWSLKQEDIPVDDEFPFKNAREALKSIPHAQRHIKALKKESSKLVETYDQKIAELEAKLERSNQSALPKTDTEEMVFTEEINKIETNLGEISSKLDGVDDLLDDPDAFSLMRKQQALTLRLSNLKQSEMMAKFQKTQDEIKAQAENERLKLDQEKEAQDQIIKQNSVYSRIDSFRNKSSDFKSTRSFKDMEKSYLDFGYEVGSAILGKHASQISEPEMEVAMAKFVENDPQVVEAIKSRGVIPPADLHEFMILSNVDMLRIGKQINSVTGKWEEVLDDVTRQRVNFPSFESAMTEWKRIHGIKSMEDNKIRTEERNSLLKAINTPGATELEPGTTTQAGTIDNMSIEEAHKFLASLDHTYGQGMVETKMMKLAQSNPNDPRFVEYKRAMASLGAPIDDIV